MTVRKRTVGAVPRSRLTDIAVLLAQPAPLIPLPPVPKDARLTSTSVTLGCDPEFFFEQDGQVIGSEKVITRALTDDYGGSGSRIVMDGVQVELNPPAGTCRETLASHMSASFRALRDHLKKIGTVKASFTTCINLSKKELDGLSEEAKRLGCAPSFNRADSKAAVTVDGATSLKRSAGGHIHLGLNSSYHDTKTMMTKEVRERLVDILDILVGNTCVLLDRDPNAAERRKVYGRAGEYRLPKHGLEYRTLSNFWLRHYVLMSFVMGIARNAVTVVSTGVSQDYYKGLQKTKPYTGQPADYNEKHYAPYIWNPEELLRAMIGGEEGLRRVRLAINTNNWDLAKQNFDRIKPFIRDHFPSGTTGFSAGMLDNFETFVTTVRDKGIEAYFPDDPLEHWANVAVGGTGWENWIQNRCGKRPFSGAGLKAIQALPNAPNAPNAPTVRARKAAPRKIKPAAVAA